MKNFELWSQNSTFDNTEFLGGNDVKKMLFALFQNFLLEWTVETNAFMERTQCIKNNFLGTHFQKRQEVNFLRHLQSCHTNILTFIVKITLYNSSDKELVKWTIHYLTCFKKLHLNKLVLSKDIFRYLKKLWRLSSFITSFLSAFLFFLLLIKEGSY